MWGWSRLAAVSAVSPPGLRRTRASFIKQTCTRFWLIVSVFFRIYKTLLWGGNDLTSKAKSRLDSSDCGVWNVCACKPALNYSWALCAMCSGDKSPELCAWLCLSTHCLFHSMDETCCLALVSFTSAMILSPEPDFLLPSTATPVCTLAWAGIIRGGITRHMWAV